MEGASFSGSNADSGHREVKAVVREFQLSSHGSADQAQSSQQLRLSLDTKLGSSMFLFTLGAGLKKCSV